MSGKHLSKEVSGAKTKVIAQEWLEVEPSAHSPGRRGRKAAGTKAAGGNHAMCRSCSGEGAMVCHSAGTSRRWGMCGAG